jgi:hypothetical protein
MPTRVVGCERREDELTGWGGIRQAEVTLAAVHKGLAVPVVTRIRSRRFFRSTELRSLDGGWSDQCNPGPSLS